MFMNIINSYAFVAEAFVISVSCILHWISAHCSFMVFTKSDRMHYRVIKLGFPCFLTRLKAITCFTEAWPNFWWTINIVYSEYQHAMVHHHKSIHPPHSVNGWRSIRMIFQSLSTVDLLFWTTEAPVQPFSRFVRNHRYQISITLRPEQLRVWGAHVAIASYRLASNDY